MIEPVGGLTSGCNVPTDAYMRRIRQICTDLGVFLVFDEVLCGAGRTGKFVTAHHWPDALPDIIVMAKALGAGHAPLGAMFAPAAMVEELNRLTGFEFSYSYNANPIACAVGSAVLDEYDRFDLCAQAVTRGAQLRTGLEQLMQRFSFLGDVRGMGLLLGVELVADKARKIPFPDEMKPTELIREHGLNNSLMIYARPTSNGKYGHWFTIAPPLTITEEECVELLERLAQTLADFAGALGL